MNLTIYNSPEYQKKMQECIDQYELIDDLRKLCAEAFKQRLRRCDQYDYGIKPPCGSCLTCRLHFAAGEFLIGERHDY